MRQSGWSRWTLFEGTREFEAFVVFAAELNREKDLHALPAQDQNLLKFALTNVLGGT
ncbi:hypothetical protein ACFSQ7_14910 [Paenibacillus rhizoplanae]